MPPSRPVFLTVNMWFVFLLRGDIRGTRSTSDLEAQKDFVCWWLCFGKKEYPVVWWYGQQHVDIAVEVVTHADHILLPRIVRYCLLSRPDLVEAFENDNTLDIVRLLCWYRINAPVELSAAPPLPDEFIALTEQACSVPPWTEKGCIACYMAVELWERVPHLQNAFPIYNIDAQHGLQAWYISIGSRLLPPPTFLCNGHEVRPPNRPVELDNELDPNGVNLIGYAQGELGIGEDVRMLSASLDRVGIPHVIIDVPFGPAARRKDTSVQSKVHTILKFQISILCLTAFDTADLFLHSGNKYFGKQYCIGYWPWELPMLPSAWTDAYTLVDEVWAASDYTLQAYRANCGSTPVIYMPPAVALPKIRKTSWRKRILRVPDAYVFLMPFDPNSGFRRKNPVTAIEAFQKAFNKNEENVALLLRVNGEPNKTTGWTEVLDAIKGDDRIYIVTKTLDRAEALGMLQGCNCLLSPHRAEGFGRNIAEAKLLGIPVLATRFSGNVEFTLQEEGIGWTPVRLRPGEYPHADGLWWAEPSLDDLAHKMQQVLHKSKGPGLSNTFDLSHAGERYDHRIRKIRAGFAKQNSL